jgi:hypothetical protein
MPSTIHYVHRVYTARWDKAEAGTQGVQKATEPTVLAGVGHGPLGPTYADLRIFHFVVQIRTSRILSQREN